MEQSELLTEDYEQVLAMRERELNFINESYRKLAELSEDFEQKNKNLPDTFQSKKGRFMAKNRFFYWQIRKGMRLIWRMLKKIRRMKIG